MPSSSESLDSPSPQQGLCRPSDPTLPLKDFPDPIHCPFCPPPSHRDSVACIFIVRTWTVLVLRCSSLRDLLSPRRLRRAAGRSLWTSPEALPPSLSVSEGAGSPRAGAQPLRRFAAPPQSFLANVIPSKLNPSGCSLIKLICSPGDEIQIYWSPQPGEGKRTPDSGDPGAVPKRCDSPATVTFSSPLSLGWRGSLTEDGDRRVLAGFRPPV